ncbi:MAG: hypothetical protein QOJ09_318 [Actinomycetota bacterium]|nr:hypothetical protein [Actinomycetota bacterium]
MNTELAVYVNNDDALIRWSVDQLDDKCLGFAIQRRLTVDGKAGQPEWLDNYAPPDTVNIPAGTHQSSADWPFRSFSWTDHSVGTGDTVSYRMVPVLDGAPAPSEDMASAWSEPKTLSLGSSTPYSGYFNRGFVISQFMSRYLDEHYPGLTREAALRKFKQDIGQQADDELRVFLSGNLRTRMLALLDDVVKGTDHIYAALFELSDEELIPRLEALGPRAHVVLSNGSVKTAGDDENAAARKRLLAKQVDVGDVDRFISPGALGHNKFLVVTDPQGSPKRAWTGSTNWTPTGLCTQLNNGLLAEDPDVAAAYLKQWHALREAKSDHPPALAAGNGLPTPVGGTQAGTVRSSVHFTRAVNKVDLDGLGEIVRGAQEGILFLMFIPGGSGVFADVKDLATNRPDLVVRGVVSELPHGRASEKTGPTTTVSVQVLGAPTQPVGPPQEFEVVQPEGNANPTAFWAAETTHKQFTSSVGYAIIHSKVLVVDPFSDDPTVVTGSHNFSLSASGNNDENFMVVQGDRALAEAYSVNVESAWRHYAGRAAGTAHATLTGIDFLRARLQDSRRSERFWHVGAGAAAGANPKR